MRVLSDDKFLSLWPTVAFSQRLGTVTLVLLALFFVHLDRDLPEEVFAGVEWCSDVFVSLLEELKLLLFFDTGQDCVEKIVIALPPPPPPPKKKTNLAGNRDRARLYFLLTSTFLWCCNFQIFSLEQKLSGCLLSISFYFCALPSQMGAMQLCHHHDRRVAKNRKLGFRGHVRSTKFDVDWERRCFALVVSSFVEHFFLSLILITGNICLPVVLYSFERR